MLVQINNPQLCLQYIQKLNRIYLIMSQQKITQLYSQYLKGLSIEDILRKHPTPHDHHGSLTLKFWQRIMNQCVKRRYLKNKQEQYENCPPHQPLKLKQVYKDYSESANCRQIYRQQMEKYMKQMEFFLKKFDKCVQEGLTARYHIDNVEQVCGNRLIKFIRGNNHLL